MQILLVFVQERDRIGESQMPVPSTGRPTEACRLTQPRLAVEWRLSLGNRRHACLGPHPGEPSLPPHPSLHLTRSPPQADEPRALPGRRREDVIPHRMMKRMLALVVLLCSACGMSESDVATAIAETEQAHAVEALIQTATAQALATDTRIPSSTVAVVSTLTPPPGSAYVPDFLGMDLSEAERVLTELDFRYIWVAMINRDVPEWQVCEQSPDPGSLIGLNEDRVRLSVAVYRFTPTSPGGGGGGGGVSCGLAESAVCASNRLLSYCEGATVLFRDCATYCAPDSGFCFPDSSGPDWCYCGI